MVPSLYCAIPTLHVTVFFFHIWWFSYFFLSHLTVPFSHCAVPTSHVSVLLSHLVVPFIFFFSHLIVPFSHYAVPISHFIVLLSHLVVPLFSLKFDGSIVTLGNTNIASDSTFVTFSCTLLFILKFDSSIITLDSTNITSDRTVVTFGGTLFFFLYLIIQLLQWVVPISHLTIILHLGPLLKSLFYLLITAYHNSNFLKVIKKFRSKIYKKKKKKCIPRN